MSPTASKPEVLVTRSDLPATTYQILKKHFQVECWDNVKNGPLKKEKFIELLKGKFAVCCTPFEPVDEDVIAAGAPYLQVISTFSVGVDHVNLKALRAYDTRLGYTPDVSTEATAELAVILLLSISRRILEASSAVKNGEWLSWSPMWMCGRGLRNSVVGIIGYGRIGHSIAVKLKAFSPKTILYSGRGEKPKGKEIGALFTDLNNLLRSSDYVILCAALTPETKHLMSRSRIALMKKSAIFVNVGRGGLVDQDALVEALEQKKICAAGLDVMTPEPIPVDHRLQKLNNCVLLPHVGSSTIETREDMALLAANNIIAVLKGDPMPAEYQL